MSRREVTWIEKRPVAQTTGDNTNTASVCAQTDGSRTRDWRVCRALNRRSQHSRWQSCGDTSERRPSANTPSILDGRISDGSMGHRIAHSSKRLFSLIRRSETDQLVVSRHSLYPESTTRSHSRISKIARVPRQSAYWLHVQFTRNAHSSNTISKTTCKHTISPRKQNPSATIVHTLLYNNKLNNRFIA